MTIQTPIPSGNWLFWSPLEQEKYTTKALVIQKYSGPLWWTDKYRILLLVEGGLPNGYLLATSSSREDIIASWDIIQAVYQEKVDKTGLSLFSEAFLLKLFKKLAKKMGKLEGGSYSKDIDISLGGKGRNKPKTFNSASPSYTSQTSFTSSSPSFPSSPSSSASSLKLNNTGVSKLGIDIGNQRRIAMLFRVLYHPDAVNVMEKTFIKQFPTPIWVNWVDERTGMYPLHVAAEKMDMDLIKYLLDKGADPSVKDGQGWSPLHFSAYAGNLDICTLLIERGAGVLSISKDGTLPLHYLVRHSFCTKQQKEQSAKFIQVLQLLLDKGTPIDAMTIRGETALHRACFFGSLQVVTFLINNHASLNSQNKRGETPLYFAVLSGNKQIVTMLVENGADCTLGGASGNSLDAAKRTEQTELFYFLCGFAASLDSFHYDEESDEVEIVNIDKYKSTNPYTKYQIHDGIHTNPSPTTTTTTTTTTNNNVNNEEDEDEEEEVKDINNNNNALELKYKEKREKLKVHHNNFYPHVFVLVDYRSPTWCSLCGYFLWGFRKQGFTCEVCGYSVHPKCKKKAVLTESCVISKQQSNPKIDLNSSTKIQEYLSTSRQSDQPLIKQSYNRKRLESLYIQFNSLDKEQHGCIYKKQFNECLGLLISESVLFSDALFEAFDSNDDGKMDLKDFLNGIGILQNSSFDEQIDFAFSMIDRKKKGYITIGELILLIESLNSSLGSFFIKAISPVKFLEHLFPKHLVFKKNPSHRLSGFIKSNVSNNSPRMLNLGKHRQLSLSTSSMTNDSPLETVSSSSSSSASSSYVDNIALKTSASLSSLPTIDSNNTIITNLNNNNRDINNNNNSDANNNNDTTTTFETIQQPKPLSQAINCNNSNNNIYSQSLPSNLHYLMKLENDDEFSKEVNLESKIYFKDYKSAMSNHTLFVQSLGLVEQEQKESNSACSKWMSFEGKQITLGHSSWVLMQHIMIGIRRAIGEAMALPNRPLKPKDYESVVDFKYSDWSFKDIAPLPFRKIREKLEIDPKHFMFSLGPEKIFGNLLLGNLSVLCEVVTSGRSGSIFFRSNEGRYLIKTLPPNEETILKQLLPSYLQHIQRFNNTLLCKTIGCYNMNDGSKDFRFIVMNNLFYTPLPIHEKYDLKGSTIGRHVDITTDEENDIGIAEFAMKDLDFKRKLNIGPGYKAPLMEQIEHDTKLLESNNICDYSLLVGVHRIDEYSPIALASDSNQDIFDVLDEGFFKSNSSTSLFQQHYGGILSADKKEIYFISIIDIFTSWDFRKKYENYFKSLVHDSNQLSAVEPIRYRKRFQKLVSHIVQ